MIPRGDGTNGTYNPDQWMEPKEQRKVDKFIVYRDVRGQAGARRCRLEARRRTRSRSRTGVMIGSGIGGVEGIAETAITLQGEGPAPGVAVLHSGPHHQSGLRLCLDRARPEGSEPRGGHRLLDRRACHRRRRPADRARRCRRDGGGRRGIAGQPDFARGLCRLPRALDRLQRHADQGVAALRQGPRRLRRWARAPASSCWRSTSTPRRAARRSMPS